MVTPLEIKNFTQGEFYQNLFNKLKNRLPMIYFSEDDIQMYNIFTKMLNNSHLSFNDLLNKIEQEHLLQYGEARLVDEVYSNNDFLEGYDYDFDEIPETISYSYSKLILIQIMIEYFYLSNNKKEELLHFLKKQRIPRANNFLDEIYNIFEKIKK